MAVVLWRIAAAMRQFNARLEEEVAQVKLEPEKLAAAVANVRAREQARAAGDPVAAWDTMVTELSVLEFQRANSHMSERGYQRRMEQILAEFNDAGPAKYQ